MPFITKFLICISVSLLSISALAAETAPKLDFYKWESEEVVGLSGFEGKIVVLDFFAQWCLPCLPASQGLEKEIQQHYQAQGGNPQGIEVEVVGINIDQSLPVRTQFYVKKAGLTHVLDDKQGAVYKSFGGQGIPFIVVLDGRNASPEEANWEIVKKFTGYEGTGPIRTVIDQVGLQNPSIEQPQPNKSSWLARFLKPAQTQLMEASIESLRSDSVELLDTSFRYRHSVPGIDIDLAITLGEIDIEYQPPPPPHSFSTEIPLERTERMQSYQLSFRETEVKPLLFNLSTRLYEGYADFRSVWIDERFRQLNQSHPLYSFADPKGWNVGGGGRWEYLPASGFLQFDMAYQYDRISPGYEWIIGQGLVRGINELDTWVGTIGFENVLSPRIRTLHQFAMVDTTAREPRLSYSGSLNYAAGEKWVWRPTVGYVQEEPTFDATSLGLTVEYEINPTWTLGVNGRYYEDSGEIEDIAVISAAAPRLDAWQLGGSLRWAGEGRYFRLQAGHYQTDYEEPGTGQVEFFHLYNDRDWFYLESTFSIEF